MIEDLCTLTDAALRTALAEWKQWLARVYKVKEISRRQERFEQAREYIMAIEREIALRSAEGCERLRQQTTAKLYCIACHEIVPLDDFRTVNDELQHINSQIVHHRRNLFMERAAGGRAEDGSTEK